MQGLAIVLHCMWEPGVYMTQKIMKRRKRYNTNGNTPTTLFKHPNLPSKSKMLNITCTTCELSSFPVHNFVALANSSSVIDNPAIVYIVIAQAKSSMALSKW